MLARARGHIVDVFSTCIFCHAPLGSNEVIETFPIGRRLAFDAERGRLWVVCRRCERWNLSPLEERWEAIEQCERCYRGTRLRASTDNVGLARLAEGLELVRIGRPQRPELAAWRYGDQFGKRRIRRVAAVGAGLGATAALVAGGAALGLSVGGFTWAIIQASRAIVQGSPRAVVARIPLEHGGVATVRRHDLNTLAIRGGTSAGDWDLCVRRKRAGAIELTGEPARRAAAMLLPAVNRFGASRQQVAEAVRLLERSDEPLAVFALTMRRADHALVQRLPPSTRIALEMAAHEDVERRALDGELAELERAWREAEEIAAIADNLLVPRRVEQMLDALRRRNAAPVPPR